MTTACPARRPGLPSLLCSLPAGHDGNEHLATYNGQVSRWIEDLAAADPWFSETVDPSAERARRKYDEALGEQLLRGFMAAGRTDTVRQLVRDLFRSGLTMHDCRGAFGQKHEGGVCLVSLTSTEGICVNWAQHDVSYEKYGEHQDVQDLMNVWLRDLMTVLGWRTKDFGTAGAFRVVGRLGDEE